MTTKLKRLALTLATISASGLFLPGAFAERCRNSFHSSRSRSA